MTRKDFNLIANILVDFKPDRAKVTTPNIKWGDRESAFKKYHSQMCASFANSLAGTNPQFDTLRFLKACGYTGE